jgi:hypothetical protein
MVIGKAVEKAKYYPFPRVILVASIPAMQISMTPEESACNPRKKCMLVSPCGLRLFQNSDT